jgi:hypothetical protein
MVGTWRQGRNIEDWEQKIAAEWSCGCMHAGFSLLTQITQQIYIKS